MASPVILMFDRLLFLFLILSPLCFSGGEDLYKYAGRFLMVGTMAMASLSILFCKPKRRILPQWPAWLILFLAFKLYYLPYHWLALNALFNVFFGLGIFYLVANYAEDIRWLYKAVAIVVVINILYGLMNHFGYNPIFKYDGSPAGFFSDNSDLTGYLILATPLLARYLRGGGFLLPLIFTVTFLYSYTAIICGTISGFLVSARRGLYPMVAIVVIGLCIIGFCNQTYGIWYKLKYRAEIWAEVAKGALRRPLAGYGMGRAIEFTTKAGQGSYTGKSDFLEFAFEVGAAVMIVISGYLIRTFFMRYVHAQKSWDLMLVSISLLAFAISLLVQSHLRNPKIGPTVMAVLGWFYVLTSVEKDSGRRD